MLHYDEPKTVQIPVRVVDGQITFFYNSQPFTLREGALGDLIVPEYDVGDRLRVLLQREQVVAMFPAQTTLWANVRPRQFKEVQDSMKQVLQRWEEGKAPTDGLFAPVVLREPLCLRLRGSKQSEILSCPVATPGLQNIGERKQDARSLNHAYARISTACEPHRVSHTGNVFDKVYFADEQNRLIPIDSRRNELEAEVEVALIVLSQRWWLASAHNMRRCWAVLGEDAHRAWVVSIIDAASIIHAQHFFASKQDGLHFLLVEKYDELSFEPAHVEDWPPAPPYRLPTGQEIALPWQWPGADG